MKTSDLPINPSDVEGSALITLTYEPSLSIGGGDPYMTKERTIRALYRNGAVLTPRRAGDGVVYDHLLTITDRPTLGEEPIRRYLTNHGTVAVQRQGGAPVVIRPA